MKFHVGAVRPEDEEAAKMAQALLEHFAGEVEREVAKELARSINGGPRRSPEQIAHEILNREIARR